MTISRITGSDLISPVLMRRVNRVRERMQELDPSEAILDDVFVLWRAFEATLDRGVSREYAERTRVAVSDVVDCFGISALPRTMQFITTLKHFERGRAAE